MKQIIKTGLLIMLVVPMVFIILCGKTNEESNSSVNGETIVNEEKKSDTNKKDPEPKEIDINILKAKEISLVSIVDGTTGNKLYESGEKNSYSLLIVEMINADFQKIESEKSTGFVYSINIKFVDSSYMNIVITSNGLIKISNKETSANYKTEKDILGYISNFIKK